MKPEDKQKTETNDSKAIDDLTLEETKSEDVKGGGGGRYDNCFVADSFSFGVEREMKES